MISEFFNSIARVRTECAGQAGLLLERFGHQLWQAGYAAITARRRLRAAEHFLYWASRRGIPIDSLTAQTVERFRRHLRRCRCPQYGSSDKGLLRGVRLFMGQLQEAGVIKGAGVTSKDSDPALLVAFCKWMRQQRGTGEATLSLYGTHIRELLRSLGETPEKFNAQNLREFVIKGYQTCGWVKAKTRTKALRMFLRFLSADGQCAAGLEAAIPVFAHHRLASLPRYLQPDDVERLIASCEPTSPVGRRNRAILLLLARLGLRVGDIVQLRLQDIEWKDGWVHVSGKSPCQTRLPLTEEVGQALVAYVKEGRPQVDSDAFFLHCRAPFCAFRSHGAVSVIVARALRQAGVAHAGRGAAHLLRHSVATSMLRHGASLPEVATLLRHRSIATTQIYAKVDVTALCKIAQPWPEV